MSLAEDWKKYVDLGESAGHITEAIDFDGSEAFIENLIPNGQQYEHYLSLDQGFNNPTAILFHAVEKKSGNVITYGEHYRREMTVKQHAEAIKQYEKYLADRGIVLFLRIADPAIKQRQQTTGVSIQTTYAQNGVNFATGQVRDINAGLDKMNDYFRLNKWFITENCINFINELESYVRADYATAKIREKNNPQEAPRKKDDHAIDSARYFFSFMPELNVKTEPINKVRPNLLDAPTLVVRPYMIDEGLAKAPSQYPVVQDEFVGEW